MGLRSIIVYTILNSQLHTSCQLGYSSYLVNVINRHNKYYMPEMPVCAPELAGTYVIKTETNKTKNRY